MLLIDLSKSDQSQCAKVHGITNNHRVIHKLKLSHCLSRVLEVQDKSRGEIDRPSTSLRSASG